MTSMVALGEVVDFYSGGTPSKSNAELWKGDVPWFSPKDLKTPRLEDSIDHISETAFASTSLRKIPKGTVALVVRGMILAHTVPIAILNVDSAINQDLKALLPRRDLDPGYLAAVLRAQHSAILSQVSTAAHGTKKLDTRVLENLMIPLPSVSEQHRVVAILDQADKLRAKRRQALAHLDALAQSIFLEAAGRRSSHSIVARDIMPSMRNGVSPASDGKFTARVLTLSAITSGMFDPSAIKVGGFIAEPPSDKRVSADDFMMCRGSGNKSLVGVGVSSPDNRFDLVFPDTVIAGRVDQGVANMTYLAFAWRQSCVRGQIMALARTTNGTFKVNQQALSSVIVPLPDLTVQREFANQMRRLDNWRQALTTASQAEARLSDSLKAHVFSGQL